MDISNYFYKDQGLFGSYPTQEDINELEKVGINLFVNLTTDEENLNKYSSTKNIINFPIKDTKIPDNNYKFVILILYISDYIKRGGKLYIHCRGGHGRSALLSACLLCKLENITPQESIYKITNSHNQRIKMNEKYRGITVPNSRIQRFYLMKIFEPLYFSKNYKNSEKNGFSNYSSHPVDIPGVGCFFNSESAYYALRNLNDSEYVNKLLLAKNPRYAKLLGEKYNISFGNISNDLKIDYMYSILKLKFSQNFELKDKLLTTGFRPIINHTKFDDFWGDNGDGSGENNLGKLIEKIRNEYYKI